MGERRKERRKEKVKERRREWEREREREKGVHTDRCVSTRFSGPFKVDG